MPKHDKAKKYQIRLLLDEYDKLRRCRIIDFPEIPRKISHDGKTPHDLLKLRYFVRYQHVRLSATLVGLELPQLPPRVVAHFKMTRDLEIEMLSDWNKVIYGYCGTGLPLTPPENWKREWIERWRWGIKCF